MTLGNPLSADLRGSARVGPRVRPRVGAARPGPAIGLAWSRARGGTVDLLMPDAPRRSPYGREMRALGRKTGQVLLLAALTGTIVGFCVLLFEQVTLDVLLDHLRELPIGVGVAMPLAGLVLAALLLRYAAGGATPGVSDEYIRNFHEDSRLPLKPVLGRMLAGVASIGGGVPLGLEGPGIYVGASVGSALQGRVSRFFSREDAKLLMVAGAAAGVAAVFKAPATGAVFAIEVPFQTDLAKRMVLPAMVGAAAGYLVIAAFQGTDPLLPVAGKPGFGFRDLGGAVLVGALCGVGARLFAWCYRRAKRFAVEYPHKVPRIGVAGVVVGGVGLASYLLTDQTLALGPGYATIRWASDPDLALGLVALILVLRFAGTIGGVAGGAVGGVFTPLAVTGALVGRLTTSLVGEPTQDLFVVVGIAAFLSAGYRAPLAGVMFVAEITGQPGFVVPGLLAAVAADLLMGESSVSDYQRRSRSSALDRRVSLPIADVLRTDVNTATPDTTVAELLELHLVGGRQLAVAVVDGAQYVGMARLDEALAVPQEAWETTAVVDVLRDDHPAGRPSWTVGDAAQRMERDDVDHLPIVDAENRFIGMVEVDDIVRLTDILDRTSGRPSTG